MRPGRRGLGPRFRDHLPPRRTGPAVNGFVTADIRRATRVIVYGRLPGTGDPVTIDADSFETRCIQHQLDHLPGLLFLDRASGALALHRKLHSCDS
ncbi:peptide deformylase [Nonomuraea cavernae]|uniref:peptide deformylase n=1 Tax=Nonomuraea cavernae TaxID=2045107 RepID=UPI0033FAE8A3